MEFWSELPEYVSEHEPLARYTSLGVGGSARWLAQPRTPDELADVLRACARANVPVRVLGLGANLLVTDEGVDGMVIRLTAPAFRGVDWGGWDAPQIARDGRGQRQYDDASPVRIRAGGGMDMNRLARDSVRLGLSGLECMAGIPGALGGIIRMNAGGRFGEISQVVREVTVVTPDGEIRTLASEQVGFRYRNTELDGAIVCEAALELVPGDPVAIRQYFLDVWGYKKKTQPLAEATAGCMFKNPPADSAGRLIDEAGLKNYRVGGAQVSDRHANFIVTQEGATASDVVALVDHIRRTVAERFGVDLELEVEVWGNAEARSADQAA